ncbi:hpp family protein [Botrytis cinerea]
MSNLDFDIDYYLNRFIPSPRLYILPTPISWFLGYRSKPRSRTGSLVVWFWAFIGAFCGIAIVENIYRLPYFKERGTPLVIASLGAAAILEYNTIDSPLSQPRNAILDFENLRWLAGALSVGVASAVMGLTNTIHPPAGATALLAATSPEITEIGWFLIPLVLLGSVLLVAIACLVNNIQRTFPIYWWTPHSLSSRSEEDTEKSSESASGVEQPTEIQHTSEEGTIKIDKHHIIIPSWLPLEYEERAILEAMQTRLQQGLQNSRTSGSDRTLVR